MHLEIFEQALIRRWGAKSATKLLTMHGFADAGSAFAAIGPGLAAAGFELIACDLPGFGDSLPLDGGSTIDGLAAFIVRLADHVSPQGPVGLVAHSLGSAIAVAAAKSVPHRTKGLISLEGNLTADDAYFSGGAADYATAEDFKTAFCQRIWKLGEDDPILRAYGANIMRADPQAMWELGCDAKAASLDDAVGTKYRELDIPSLYIWSRGNVPESSIAFLRHWQLEQVEIAASHWPMLSDAECTMQLISDFFLRN